LKENSILLIINSIQHQIQKSQLSRNSPTPNPAPDSPKFQDKAQIEPR